MHDAYWCQTRFIITVHFISNADIKLDAGELVAQSKSTRYQKPKKWSWVGKIMDGMGNHHVQSVLTQQKSFRWDCKAPHWLAATTNQNILRWLSSPETILWNQKLSSRELGKFIQGTILTNNYIQRFREVTALASNIGTKAKAHWVRLTGLLVPWCPGWSV